MLNQIVNRLVLWGFFDKELFDSVKVLTSENIQATFFEATKRRKTPKPTKYIVNVNSNSQSETVNADINTQSNVDGVGNELNSQVALRASEMKIDLNRKLILNLISSTNNVETAAAGAVTRKDIDALFKTMFQKGYMGEKLCLVAPDMQELMTDQLDEKSTKIVQFGDKLTFGLQLGNIVSNYGSGIALIEPNLPNGTIAAIDTNYVKLRPLREWRAEELAKTTDSRRIGLVGEYSIEYKASNSGAILNLKA